MISLDYVHLTIRPTEPHGRKMNFSVTEGEEFRLLSIPSTLQYDFFSTKPDHYTPRLYSSRNMVLSYFSYL